MKRRSREAFQDVCGFESENVILMVDDEGHPLQFQPKERNIVSGHAFYPAMSSVDY